MIFHSIQHCAHLLCKYGHFWGEEGSAHSYFGQGCFFIIYNMNHRICICSYFCIILLMFLIILFYVKTWLLFAVVLNFIASLMKLIPGYKQKNYLVQLYTAEKPGFVNGKPISTYLLFLNDTNILNGLRYLKISPQNQ